MYKGPDYATGRLRPESAQRLGLAQAQSHAPAHVETHIQVQGANQARDEVQDFIINSYYISANEAVWRIFEFPTHGRDVAVTVLQFHLEGEHSVAVNAVLPLADQTARIEKNTTLTAYFEQNDAVPVST